MTRHEARTNGNVIAFPVAAMRAIPQTGGAAWTVNFWMS
jgi:hypothetical protein